MTFFMLATSVEACYYDADMTIDLEKGLPPIEAILAGKFEQNSSDFYDYVIKDQSSRVGMRYVPGQPISLPYALVYAPALARRGKLTEALEAIDPNRNYATVSAAEYATRGAILLASGDFEEAEDQLRRAVEMNPRNSFGRDDHQLRLAQYLRQAKLDPTLTDREPTFVSALLREVSSGSDPRLDAAQTAIAAMIRYEDPCPEHLFAALGELLEYRDQHALAYRAFRRSLELNHPRRDLLEPRLQEIRTRLGDSQIDATIDSERLDAAKWVSAYQAEQAARFPSIAPADLSSFYAAHGNLRERAVGFKLRLITLFSRFWPALSLSGALAAVGVVALHRRLKQRKVSLSADGGLVNAAG